MTVWSLLWQLIAHAAHGRGRDRVYLSVNWDTPAATENVNAAAEEFTWEKNVDAFCTLAGTTTHPPRT